ILLRVCGKRKPCQKPDRKGGLLLKSSPSVTVGLLTLPAWVVPVTIGELLIVPVRSDQALHCVSQHPEIMPVAELIELARAAQRFHLWQARGSLPSRTTKAPQRQR